MEEAEESHYWFEIVRDTDLKSGKEVDKFAATDKTAKMNRKKSEILKPDGRHTFIIASLDKTVKSNGRNQVS